MAIDVMGRATIEVILVMATDEFDGRNSQDTNTVNDVVYHGSLRDRGTFKKRQPFRFNGGETPGAKTWYKSVYFSRLRQCALIEFRVPFAAGVADQGQFLHCVTIETPAQVSQTQP